MVGVGARGAFHMLRTHQVSNIFLFLYMCIGKDSSEGEMLVPRRGGVSGWSPKGASELVTHLQIRKRESILTAFSQLNKKRNVCLERGRS